MKSSARPIIGIVLVLAAAIAFWTLALSPKREEVKKLDAQVESLESSVEGARGELAAATSAQHAFPASYRQLVELGQAVPATDETPSLLVELEKLANRSEVSFKSIALEGEGEAAPEVAIESPPPAETGSTGTQVADVIPATEVEASLLPLGASIGGAGLATMPYTLSFDGSFFGIAKFIGKVDELVESGPSKMQIAGRLVTINGFSLSTGESESEGGGGGAGSLQASFSVTTYLTPPEEGITAGATPSGPESQTVAAE